MNPVLIQLGPLQVHWYGILIVTGAVLAAWLATKEAKRRGEDPEHVWSLLIWVLIFGIIGGRRFSKWSRDGDVFFLYLIWYPVGRFWVEMFRPDAWRIGTLATAQWFALAGIALGVTGLLLNHFHSQAGKADESSVSVEGHGGAGHAG
jgi:prolipoprotein diacylglyceryltransferase